jgi:homoserine kinase type II
LLVWPLTTGSYRKRTEDDNQVAQFRSLTDSDVRDILSRFGFPPEAYRGHAAIAVGTVNTNVRVETTEGPRFLRINEGKTADDVAREAAIVAFVAARGVPTPAPARAGEGQPFAMWQGQFVSLFPWSVGRTLVRSEMTSGHARQAGRALAHLHRVGADFPDRRAGRYEPDEIDRRLARVEALAATDVELAAAAAVLRPELEALGHERRADLPEGLIHGDLFIDNVLYDGAKLVSLLDFEQASWGYLAYDLAVTLLAFAFGHDDFRPEVVRAVLEGYAAERPPTETERAAFGAELRFAACRFAVTRITDVYSKRTAGAAPGKDFRRYLLRLRRVKEHESARDGLLALP